MKARALCFWIVAATLSLSADAWADPVEVWPSPRQVVADEEGLLRFRLVVANTGVEHARDVRVEDALAEGAELVESHPAPRIEGDRLIWALGDVAPGSSASIEVVLRGGPDLGASVSSAVGAPRDAQARPVLVDPIDPSLLTSLAPTIDADAADPEVLALAARFDGDPVRLHAFVQKLLWQPYEGSLRGARGTIWSGAGNALDRASLLVALLRASGVPARYVGARLDEDQARALILAMFPERKRAMTAGLSPEELVAQLHDPDALRDVVPPAVLDAIQATSAEDLLELAFPDPAADPRLLALAQDHASVEFFDGDQWILLDPVLDEAPAELLAPFDEIDPARRHAVSVRVTSESFNPLFGAGLASREERAALTMNTVELVGRPVALRHQVDTRVQSGLVFGTILHTYSPELVVGDQVVAQGAAFQEIFSNFPGGNQILMGIFIDVEVRSPGAAPFEYSYAVLDRLGAAARSNSLEEDQVVTLGGLGEQRAIQPSDVVNLHVSGWGTPARATLAAQARTEALKREALKWQARLAELQAAEGQVPSSAAGRRAYDEASRAAERTTRQLGELLGLNLLELSEIATSTIAESLRVVAFAAEPRLTFVESRVSDLGPEVEVDLARDDVEVIAPRDVGIHGTRTFNTARGLTQTRLEGLVLAPWANGVVPVDTPTVLDFARQQGIQVRVITRDDALDLYRLPIPRDAREQLLKALGRGKAVMMPEQEVIIEGQAWFSWLEYEPATGKLISADANNRHVAAVSYALRLARNECGYRCGYVMGFLTGFFGALGILGIDLALMKANPTQAVVNATAGLGFAALGCFHTGAGGAGGFGYALGAGGASVDVAIGAGIAVGLSLAGAVDVPGIAGAALGLNTGLCHGSIIGGSILLGIAAGVAASDPHLPPGTTDAIGPVRRPLSFSRLDLDGLDAVGLRAPPGALAGEHLRLSGDFSATFDGQAALKGGERLQAQGTFTNLDTGEVVLDGAGELSELEWVSLEGSASMSASGSLARYDGGGPSVALDDLQLALEGGRAAALGTLGGQRGVFLVEADAILISGGEALAMPDRATLQSQGASLALDGEAHGSFVGQIALDGAQVSIEGGGQRIATISGAPGALALRRGEVGVIAPRASSSLSGEARWSAEGPESWDVSFDEQGRLLIQPEAGAQAGRTEAVHLWLEVDGIEGVAASRTIAVTLEEDAEAVEVGLRYDPLFTTVAAGVVIPTVFQGAVVNRGSAARRFALRAEVPEGFSGQLAAPSLLLEPGERGSVVIAVGAPESLPAPGTPLRVRLVAGVGGVEGSAEVEIPLPAAQVARLTFEPALHRLLPGAEAQVTMRARAFGNAPGRLELALTKSGQLDLEGLPEFLDVTPGEEIEVPLRVRVGPEAVVGLSYIAMVSVYKGEIHSTDEAIRVDIIGPDEDQAVCAAEVAGELGDAELEAALLSVADRISRVLFRCEGGDVFFLAQATQTLAAELSDPVLAGIRADLQSFSARNSAAQDCEQVDLPALVEALGRLKVLLAAMRDHDFRLGISPGGVLITPGEAAAFSLDAERLGALPTTLELTLEGVEGQVASPIAPEPLVEGHPVVVEPIQTGRIAFRVRATVREAPELSRTVQAVVVSEGRWVAVGAVGADPPFAIPGAALRLFADLFNVANLPLDLEADVEVRRPDDTVLYASEAPVALRLPVSTALRRYAIGNVFTFGEPAGHYTVRVRLRRPGEQEIVPGGEGVGVVFIGQPLDADVVTAPALLPPGDVGVEVVIGARRRPMNILPGVGNPSEIQIFASDTAGPAGLALGADGQVYFSSFGTARSSDIPGYIAGQTVGRVNEFDGVETVATVPPSSSEVALGPDGAIYAVNVGNPERIVRIDPLDSSVTTWWDFQVDGTVGNDGNGENITGIAFDAAGNLYATELFEPVIFSITRPGEWIIRLTPDENGDGRADSAAAFVRGFQTPTLVTLDPRNQDLIVCDTGNRRIARANTVGVPAVASLIGDFDQCSGLAFDDLGNLFALNDVTGRVMVTRTAVVNGATRPEGELLTLFGGLLQPYNLIFDAQGDLITNLVDEDLILRVRMDDPSPPPLIELSVNHRTVGDTAIEGSAQPDLGPDGPIWQEGEVIWSLDMAPEDAEARFTVGHALEGLEPGMAIPLSEGTTVSYAVNGVSAEVELPPVEAMVDHFVGLSPDLLQIRKGTRGRVTLHVRNHRDAIDTVALSVESVTPGIAFELPAQVVVPALGQATVDLFLNAGDGVELGQSRYVVRASSGLGGQDRVVGLVEVIGGGISIAVTPVRQEIRRGQTATFTLTFTKSEGDTRRGFTYQSFGLNQITSNRREISGLVDFLRGPVVSFEVSRQILARAGTTSFEVVLNNLGVGTDPDPVARTTATITVVDDHGVSISAEPVRTGRSQPFTINAVLTNEGSSTRHVRLSDCCGVLFGASFNAGPHELPPGTSRTVPIRYSPNGILVGDYFRRLTITDVADSTITAALDARVSIEQPGGNLEILNPTVVTAVDGRAQLTARLSRAFGSAGGLFEIEVQGPLTRNTIIEQRQLDLFAASRHDIPIRFTGLEEIAPGPWPVRVLARSVPDPDLFFEAFGTVIIPEGGLSVGFDPPFLVVPGLQPANVLLEVFNHDYARPAQASLTLDASSPDVTLGIDLDAVSLAPGARDAAVVTVTPQAPGEVLVNATATPGEGEVAQTQLVIRFLDPADAPSILNVRLEPAEPVEGEPFRLTVEAEDPNGDLIVYDFDTDGDGAFDTEGDVNPSTLLLFPDDGEVVVRVAARDREGGVDVQDVRITVLNADPRFTSLPPGLAAQGVAMSYTPVVVDPGDDVVTVRLSAGPEGATFEGGALRWTPTPAQARAGAASIELEAADEDGGQSLQRWQVVVRVENALPAAPTLVSPVDRQAAEAPVRLIYEAATDADGDPLTYAVEVFRDDVLIAERSADALFVDLDPGDTPEGRYAWRASASDGIGFGPFSPTAAFVVGQPGDNRLPEAPEILSPEQDEVVDGDPLQITWAQAADADGDPLVYELQIDDDPAFEAPVVDRREIPMGQEATVAQSVADLPGGQRWHLRVRALDPFGAGPFAERAFEIANRPPGPPALTAPVDGQRVDPGPVALRLERAADPDGHALTYEVRVFSDAELLDEVASFDLPDAEVERLEAVFEAPEAPAAWFWTAQATDALGLEGPLAGPEEFNVLQDGDNAPPPAPRLISPIEGAEVAPGQLQLTFEGFEDPDGDALTYAIEVLSADDGEVVARRRGLAGEPGAVIELALSLDLPGDYLWTATATDARGLDSAPGGPAAFTVKAPARAPGAPTAISPVDGDLVDPQGFDLVIGNAVDPDGDTLTYTFRLFAKGQDALLIEVAGVAQGQGGQTAFAVEADALLGQAGGERAFDWEAFATDTGGLDGPSTGRATFALDDPPSVVDVGTVDGDCDCATPDRPAPRSRGALWLALGLLALVWRGQRRRAR